MVGNSANYLLNNWCIYRYTMNSYKIMANYMQAFVLLPKILYFK